MGFHGLRHAAELRERQAARLVDRNAVTLEFLGRVCDVRVDLGSKISIAFAFVGHAESRDRKTRSLVTDYSVRKVAIGSILVARRAGT
jgi:hypothetical protein